MIAPRKKIFSNRWSDATSGRTGCFDDGQKLHAGCINLTKLIEKPGS